MVIKEQIMLTAFDLFSEHGIKNVSMDDIAHNASISKRTLYELFGGSRNLVGIAIQLSDSEEEEFFVGYPMLISPEKFDFGIERFGCGI